MDVSTFIVTVLCAVVDWLEGEQPLRRRGPKSKLSDSEVPMIEIAGEFLGIDTDRGLYAYVRQNHGEWFPALKEVVSASESIAATILASSHRLHLHTGLAIPVPCNQSLAVEMFFQR